MPKRMFKHRGNRFPCDEVQGEDSYVVFDRLTVAEAREFSRLTAEDNPRRQDKRAVEMMARKIMDWNWVDDDGEPLPVPSTDGAVIDRLTDPELSLLARLFARPTPSEAEIKN